ncbi:MAG: HNH endonuclease, partial [Chloroflexota bacterium]|nr:HNH endonuclease [Chloroflexota bacterium]
GKKITDKVRRVLDFLSRAFPEKTPELKKTSVVSLYLLVSTLMDTHVIATLETSFGEWFIDFETTRSEDEGRPQDERDLDMVSYHEHMTRATNSEDSIRLRHEILSRAFMLAFPDLPRLDNQQREFSFEQRLAIYRKYGGICQWVDEDGTFCGVKCSWSDWHADHIVPWSRGGSTTVANGQLLCPKHNLSKGANLPHENSGPEPEGNSRTAEWIPLSTPKSIRTSIKGPKYSSVLNKLCDWGWKPEQLPGQGRTAYALDSSGKTLAIFRHALKQKKGRSDFYFFGLSRILFQKCNTQGRVYVFLQCGTPASVLVIPGDYFQECFRDVPISGETEDWKVNVFTDGKLWTWQPSGKPRLDVTKYLNSKSFPIP